MTLIHAYNSQSQYDDHTRPIFDALPPEMQGGRAAPRDQSWGKRAPMPMDGLWLVAGLQDAQALGPNRRVILVNHGAGQRYEGDTRSAGHGSFVGGAGLDNVVLFIDPRQECSDLWLERYPKAAAVAVGVPKMDRYHLNPRPRNVSEPTVAFTFHHQGGICPETSWALPFYRESLRPTIAALRAAGCVVIGHGHPRAAILLRRLWGELGVEWVARADEVFDRADLLVADNTSLQAEAASVGIPLCWLNASWYRRDVWHGARYWSWPLGQVQVDDPADLFDGIMLALSDPPQMRDARQRMVHTIYAATDGHAAERAVEAILALDAQHPSTR